MTRDNYGSDGNPKIEGVRGWAPNPDDPTPGMHLPGWIYPSDLRWLGAQAAQMRSVVEVGSFRGRSSYALATACPGLVYCIDPWPGDVWDSWWESVGSVLSNVVALRGESPAMGSQVPDPVDMVFIDGSHEYEDVHADIVYWRERVRVLLCGHDFTTFPGVKRAVKELLGIRATLVEGTWIWATWMQ